MRVLTPEARIAAVEILAEAEPGPERDAQIARVAAAFGEPESAIRDEIEGLSGGNGKGSEAADPVWPSPLAPEAFHGVLGEMVRLIEPHSEADPAALLTNAIVAVGNVIGSGPHIRVEGDLHPARFFVVHVGTTAKGRKGTAWGQIRNVVRYADDDWAASRIVTGLSSGEGVIYHVRDKIERRDKQGALEVVDEGISDKRMLVVEGEFASTLKVMGREGNTLSPVLRNGWDSGTLRTLTKNSPLTATGAHLGIIGHITRDELLGHLSSTEMANGFGNRFLWIAVARSKALAFGGEMHRVDLGPITGRLQGSIERARGIERVDWAPAARPIWAGIYEEISAGKPGLVGAMTSRAEAQVLRLAVLYAVLDGSALIEPAHLYGALAVWEYAAESVRWIFADRTGNPLADRLRRVLRDHPDGLTRTAIQNEVGRHYSARELDDALELLAAHGLCRVSQLQTGGRPATVYAPA